MRRNERDWAGQLISWIHQAIANKVTLFEDATNDSGIKVASGTKFPDILLFSDKVSGIVFNGWELKFPDTPVDDLEMLRNALEKAQHLRSNSLVTWNGAEAIIWEIPDEDYRVERLIQIKKYPGGGTINTRDDLADPAKFALNEAALRSRALEILHDLEQLYKIGRLRHAINITGNIVEAVKAAAVIMVPQFQDAIATEKGRNASFRGDYNKWRIYESSTLKILASSSRRPEHVLEEAVLAKFTFYNLIGKILFHLTLSENLSGLVGRINIVSRVNIKATLEGHFQEAQSIDYQAIFKPYFTDTLPFSPVVEETLFHLIEKFMEFDFRILPAGVIGNILENLIPKEEKQKFGQYFTSETLANLVAFPAIQTNSDVLFDPTSGTGTFLNSFYQILKYHRAANHETILNQIWGNDISHFPALLSVISLYKQDVTQTANFPRVVRDDFFSLNPGDSVTFPNSQDFRSQIEQPIPKFNAIASNFPFIQQEDIPNDILTGLFREKFQLTQQAFLQDETFKINERSDYFAYCIYNAIRFLQDNGFIAAITSNAWLGKEYGIQFKDFLLDNFHIKYIVRSSAEHWFTDSKVSTIYTVLQKGHRDEPTKFVTLKFKLQDYLSQNDTPGQLRQIEDLYSEIDNCNDERNGNWRQDATFNNLYCKVDGLMDVCIVDKRKLLASLEDHENWQGYFVSPDLFQNFEDYLTVLYPDAIDAFRGERTGWNDMFIIPEEQIADLGIEPEFLIPYVKSPTELDRLEFSGDYKFRLFVCDKPIDELKKRYKGAYTWIKKFEGETNKNGSKTIMEACAGHRPYWYSLRPKRASIVTAINPYERFFFSFSSDSFTIDQRLVAININDGQDLELIAALFNSVVTFLTVEMRGTSRNLGALDLNANYFKNQKILNPGMLTGKQKTDIKRAFRPLTRRAIGKISDEVNEADRRHFDAVVLRSFGINEQALDGLYEALVTAVGDRVSMKDR